MVFLTGQGAIPDIALAMKREAINFLDQAQLCFRIIVPGPIGCGTVNLLRGCIQLPPARAEYCDLL